jgi:repressor LexA
LPADIIRLYISGVAANTFTPIAIRGEVSAGRPIRSEEDGGGCISVDLSTIGINPSPRTFALKVRGDSMIGSHILDGDTIVLELKAPHDGAIVAALVDGESTLKRYFVRRGAPFLKANNPKYPDVIPASELVIQGVLVAVFRKA